MEYIRFLPVVVPVLVFCLQQLYLIKPKMIYVVVLVIILAFIYAAKKISSVSSVKVPWFNYAILPICFSSGNILFSILMPDIYIKQAVIILNLIFLSVYFRIIYYRLTASPKYREYSLENISSYGNFLAFYFIASGLYGLKAYLNTPIWLLMIVLIVAIGLMVYEVIWANNIRLQTGFFYMCLMAIVLVELAWSTSFLTLSFYILGLLLAICYYILIGLIRYYLIESLDKKNIKHYLVFGFICILVVLLTSRWL